MNWQSWYTAWLSWWNGWRRSQAEEPPTPEPGGPTPWQPKDEEGDQGPAGSKPAGQLPDGRCVTSPPIEIPPPSPIDVDCGASGVVDPPPPPTGDSILLRMYERGPKKLFMPIYEVSNQGDSSQWYFNSSMPADIPFGEKILVGFFGQVFVPGGGKTIAGPPFGGPNLMAHMLLGSRSGPSNLAPPLDLPHLFPNSLYLRVFGAWHSFAAGLNIESWRPFKATVCLSNSISGLPQFTQVGQQSGSLFLPPNSVSNWSTAYNVWAGCSVELVIEEYTPTFP